MNLPEWPLFLPWAHVRRTPDRLVCYCGDRTVTFRGEACKRFLPALLPELNGARRLDQILGSFDAEAREAVEKALGEIAARKLIVNGPTLAEPTATEAAAVYFLARFRMKTPKAIQDDIRSWKIAIFGGSGVAARVAGHLGDAGVRHLSVRRDFGGEDAAERRDLTVICPSSDQAEALAAWNKDAVACGAPWFFASGRLGQAAFAGPLFTPPETGCFECFSRRRRAHSLLGENFGLFSAGLAECPTPGFVEDVVASASCNSILRWLLTRDPFLPGRCEVVEAGRTFSIGKHSVFRVPRCPVCSRAAGTSVASPWAVAAANEKREAAATP